MALTIKFWLTIVSILYHLVEFNTIFMGVEKRGKYRHLPGLGGGGKTMFLSPRFVANNFQEKEA